jgi:hypothetical protein
MKPQRVACDGWIYAARAEVIRDRRADCRLPGSEQSCSSGIARPFIYLSSDAPNAKKTLGLSKRIGVAVRPDGGGDDVEQVAKFTCRRVCPLPSRSSAVRRTFETEIEAPTFRIALISNNPVPAYFSSVRKISPANLFCPFRQAADDFLGSIPHSAISR